MRIKPFIPVLLILLLGCKINKTTYWINPTSPDDLVLTLNELDAQVIKGLKEKDFALLRGIFSDALNGIVNAQSMNNMIFSISPYFENREYSYKDKIYSRNSNIEVSNTIFVGKDSTDDYRIVYRNRNEEVYISLITPVKEGENILLVLVYGKYEDGWRLNIIKGGQYTIQDKTAPDYYLLAKEYLESGHLVDAKIASDLGITCMKPGEGLFKYQIEKDLEKLNEEINEEVKTSYNFPMKLADIETTPQIFEIDHIITAKGVLPMINYVSSITLRDTASLKSENLEIRDKIGGIFKGVESNNKFILYRAYDRMPIGENPRFRYYGFVQKL